MKIGIIGLGRVFNHYLKNFIDTEFLEEHELIICDSDSKLLANYKKQLLCKGELGIESLVSHKPVLKPAC